MDDEYRNLLERVYSPGAAAQWRHHQEESEDLQLGMVAKSLRAYAAMLEKVEKDKPRNPKRAVRAVVGNIRGTLYQLEKRL